MEEVPQPNRQISPKAIKVWRLSNILEEIIILIVLTGLLSVGYYFSWYHWVLILFWIGFALIPVDFFWSYLFEPKLARKYWRYGINDGFVQIKQGILKTKFTIVPMTKIQYVEAEQGLLLRKYDLYTVSIGTIQSTHAIPALDADEAFALRDCIAKQAKLKEVD